MQRKVWIACLAGVFGLPALAAAHNLGHVFQPDGTCVEIGSAREAPLVGKDRLQLDLVPATPNPPRDEFGVSFVGYWGQTPILPGRCPATPATLTGQSSTASKGSAATTGTAQPASGATSPGASGPWFGAGRNKEK